MIVLDVGIVLLLALVFSLMLTTGFNRRGPGIWSGFFFFFFLLLLLTWSGGLWIGPLMFAAVGGIWLTYLLIATIMSLVLLAVIPPTERPAHEVHDDHDVVEEAGASLGIAFWALVMILIATLVIHYAAPIFANT